MTENMELQNTQDGTNENLNNSNYSNELIAWEDIKGSPFKITGNQENGYFIVMGNYRLTQACKTIAEAENLLYTEQWNIIIRMIYSALDFQNHKTKEQ